MKSVCARCFLKYKYTDSVGVHNAFECIRLPIKFEMIKDCVKCYINRYMFMNVHIHTSVQPYQY